MTVDTHHKHDRSYISRGSWVYLSGLILRLGARIPLLLIAGHLYGAALYGEYVIAIAVVETAAAAATLGFKRTLFSFMQGGDENIAPAMRHALVIGIGFAVIFSAILMLFAPG